MKPGFALSLSFEGITLLLRSATGWRRVGDVSVDTDDLSAAMDGLRRSATALSPSAMRSKIVLPNDQVRYLTIETGELDSAARRDAAARALDGATPYPVDDLSFDIAADGPLTHVAAVARETLAEAEGFAVEHRFEPVSFVATPEPGDYPGEPFFGQTEHAASLLAPGETVEPDKARIERVELSDAPDGPIAADEAAVSAGGDSPTGTRPVAAEVSSPPPEPVRNDAGGTEHENVRAAAAPEIPSETAPEIPLPRPRATGSESRVDRASEAGIAAPATAPAATGDRAPPVAGQAAGGPARPGADTVARPTDQSAAAPLVNAASAPEGEPSGGFASRRGRGAELPDDVAMPPRSARAEIVPIPAHKRTPPPPSRPAPTVAAPRAQAPNQTFSSSRAPSPAAQGAAPVRAPGTPPGAPKGPGPAAAASRRTVSPEPAAEAPRSGFMSRRRATPAMPAPEPDPIPDLPQSDAERMTVFGARKKEKPRAKPRFLGLILTAILLAVMVGVAAFASIFNDTPVSRLFSRDPVETATRSPGGTETATGYAPASDSASDTASEIAAIDPRILGMEAEVLPAPPNRQQAGDTGPADISTESPLIGAPDDADSGPALSSEPDADLASARDNAPLELADSLTETDAAVLDALRAPGATPDDGLEETAETALDPEEVADAPLPEEAPVPGVDSDSDSTIDNAATYAATGIWSNAPENSDTPGVIPLDDLFIAAIDGATQTTDALALPAAQSYDTDISPNGVTSPAEPGIDFELDALGLVEPTPEGTVTPDGILVFLGQPSSVPPPTPPRLENVDPQEPLEPDLPATRPRTRPGDLVDNAERVRLGGLTLEELGGVRPRERPYEPEPEVSETVETADPVEEDAAPETADEPEYIPLGPNEMHLAAKKPQARPSGFSRTVARARRAAPRQQATASAGPAAAASTASSTASLAAPSTSNRNAPAVPRNQSARPTGPTPATVARQATIKNAINLRQVNLIGVYGTPSNRRALVRLSSGRYRKVQVGDRIDGGRVVAIGDAELRYQKGGRNVVLRMPRG